MAKLAVIKTGGKQYLVKEGDEITVDRLPEKEGDKLEVPTLAIFDGEEIVSMGEPLLKEKTAVEIVKHGKGDKIRVAKFKSKVRYRRVTGFRPSLTTIKISKIG